MKIKKIKEGHITNCQYCKKVGNKTQAVWYITLAGKQACEAHKHFLTTFLDERKAFDRDVGYSEADYQTWLRL